MILVLGGTSDSLAICDKLNKKQRSEEIDSSYIVSVTTEYGKTITKKHTDNVMLGRLTQEDMLSFVKENKVDTIIDATHPYAVEVSKNAIKCAKLANINYIRYERKSLIEEIKYENKFIVNSIDEACLVANETGTNIFIGTGSKNLDVYVNKIKGKNLVARVLPTSEVLVSCEKLGLNADNIIAMKGPFSVSMNKETYEHYNIDLVITKESGIQGGFLEKVEACEELNIPIVIIAREKIEYPKAINKVDELDYHL